MQCTEVSTLQNRVKLESSTGPEYNGAECIKEELTRELTVLQ